LIDVKAILDEFGIDYKSSGKNVGPNDVNVDCPFCGSDKHLGIHTNKAFINCWVCEFGDEEKYPSFASVISMLADVDIVDVFAVINANSDDEETPEEQWDRPLKTVPPPNCHLFEHTFYTRDRDAAYTYLTKRGFSKRHIEQYSLMFTPAKGDTDEEKKYAGRIIFPIYHKDWHGVHFASWLGRDYTHKQQRYKNCEVKNSLFRIKETLFGLESFEGKHLRIVEGVFDRMALGNTSVASMKAKISREQRRIIINLDIESMSIMFDMGDGFSNSISIAEDFSPFVQKIKILEFDTKEDVAELGKKKVLAIERRTPWFVG